MDFGRRSPLALATTALDPRVDFRPSTFLIAMMLCMCKKRDISNSTDHFSHLLCYCLLGFRGTWCEVAHLNLCTTRQVIQRTLLQGSGCVQLCIVEHVSICVVKRHALRHAGNMVLSSQRL
jgi:hypothetical protein